MPTKEKQRLIEDNVILQTVGIGLYALVIRLLEEYLRTGSDNKEADFARLRMILDPSIAELRVNTIGLPMTEDERRRIESDAQQRISSMLDYAYRTAREDLGLNPELPPLLH